jgi:hypothetical protein
MMDPGMQIAQASIVTMRALPTVQPRPMRKPETQPPRMEPTLEPV